jgi:hypothetical protein
VARVSEPGAPAPRLGCTRGALYVEFLIGFLPMFCFFLLLVQYGYLQTASVVVNHAAATTARAAIVVLHDDPKHYGGAPVGRLVGERKEEIERAALMVLEPIGARRADVDVVMKESFERDDLVELTLQFRYRCRVPFARRVVCGDAAAQSGGPSAGWADGEDLRELAARAALPNQGADYEY